MSEDHPFKTRFGRVLDQISRHPKARPYVVPLRRALRKLWVFVVKHPNLRSFFAYATPKRIAVAIVVLVAFIYMLASMHRSDESHKRHIYADIQRISNLEQIRLDIRQYHLKRDRLPDSIKQLESDNPNPRYVRDGHFYDPETMAQMEYRTTSSDGYELCATFNYSTERVEGEVPDTAANGPIWHHESGHHCFQFAVATNQSVPAAHNSGDQ